ncbi:rhomboid family intramembrane serine protease [soil metagenome]
MSITIILLGITVITSLIAFSNEELQRKWILNPYLVQHRNQWWRMITSGFIHADTLHLFVNMFVLFGFGQAVERYYDAIFTNNSGYYFVALYLGGVLVANAPSLAKHKDQPHYNSLGASGAVSAVMFSAILFEPWTKLYLFGIIGIPGIIMGPLYLFFEYRMGIKGGTGINHDAHFWGAIFGLIFTIALKPTIFLHFISQLSQGFPL